MMIRQEFHAEIIYLLSNSCFVTYSAIINRKNVVNVVVIRYLYVENHIEFLDFVEIFQKRRTT